MNSAKKDSIEGVAIHPEWPSVTSLAGVFSKKKKNETGELVKKSHLQSNQRQEQETPGDTEVTAVALPTYVDVPDAKITSVRERKISLEHVSQNAKSSEKSKIVLERKISVENGQKSKAIPERKISFENGQKNRKISLEHGQTSKAVLERKISLENPTQRKSENSKLMLTRKISLGNEGPKEKTTEETQKTVLQIPKRVELLVPKDQDVENINRRGSFVESYINAVQAANAKNSERSKEVPVPRSRSEKTRKEQTENPDLSKAVQTANQKAVNVNTKEQLKVPTSGPIPKERPERPDRSPTRTKNDVITEAAMKVANAFGKPGSDPAPDSNSKTLTPIPVPKNRTKITQSSEIQSTEEGKKPVPLPKDNVSAQPRQIRSNENRLGVYKDVVSDPPPIVRPVASVPPTEVNPLREVKISEIIEKWPPGPDESSDPNNNEMLQESLTKSDNNKSSKKVIRFDESALKMDKFASILVIGLSGSGKSSMIDELLDQQVPKLGKGEIVEYTLEVQMPDSDEAFRNMRIIDTPGFTSDKSGSSFARMFSTLLQYCRSQEGLRGKVPNLVLCVIPFKDTFSESESSDLVQFLKIIHHFESHFKNTKFPNFIFVLTHLASAPKRDQNYPELKINEFIDLVKKYTTLTKPISVICAENQGEAAGLQVEDGFYKLPNGEMYPNNLIQAMKSLLTRKGHISLSESIIRSAFGPEYPNSIQISGTKLIPQLKEDSPSISQMKQTLRDIYSQIKIERSEISLLLQVGWENVNPALQKTFASSLLDCQRVFQTRKINDFADLPTESGDIFQLLRELPQNLAVSDLLIHTLQFKIPHNSQALFIGQGYDLSQDRRTNISPLLFTNIFKTSPIGQIPNELQCHVTQDRAMFFKFFYEPEEYVLDRMKELGIRHASFPGNLPMPTLKRPGYNLIKENQEPTKSTVATALLEYRAFRLTLHETDDLFEFKSVFWDALSSLPQLESKSLETVQIWKDFFGCWGTHLVKSAYGGGSIEINFKGKMLAKVFSSLNQADTIPSDDDMTNRVFQWITGDGLDFASSSSSMDTKGDFLKGLDVQTSIQGGDEKFRDLDFTKLPYDQVGELRMEWKESLFQNPVMLETNLVLVPISYFVRQKCEVTALKMDMAFHYIYSQFISQIETKNSSCAIL